MLVDSRLTSTYCIDQLINVDTCFKHSSLVPVVNHFQQTVNKKLNIRSKEEGTNTDT